ncbi:MAG: type II secretion system minor pseudopilin GspK [Thermodesulfovibrionales bacterium]
MTKVCNPLLRRERARVWGYSNNQQGVALVVVLLALVLLTAMVVEFSYGVYTGTNDLYNWRDAQRLSVMARSGINVSVRYLSNLLKDRTFKFTEPVEMPVENPFEDFKGNIAIRVEDEMGKFNLNSIVPLNQIVNETDQYSPYSCFKRLLTVLSLDVKIADRIVDWIDKNGESRLSDSEAGAKNAILDSVDELLLIHGISKEDYDKLLPYITIYGNGEININSASKPVIRCLSNDISDELAQRVIDYRKSMPFKVKADLQNVNGFSSAVYNPFSDMITSESSTFSIKSTASSGGVKRVIETVLDTTNTVQYWKEY